LWKWREQFQQRSAMFQAREEVGGIVATPAPTSADPPNPPPATQIQQQSLPMPSLSRPNHSFPMLSNAFQRPITPILPAEDLVGNKQSSAMLPIPVSGPGGTPGASGTILDLDASLFGFAAGTSANAGPGLSDEDFNLNWVLDGYEFLMPGDGDDVMNFDAL